MVSHFVLTIRKQDTNLSGFGMVPYLNVWISGVDCIEISRAFKLRKRSPCSQKIDLM
jgi:hypothetical protein